MKSKFAALTLVLGLGAVGSPPLAESVKATDPLQTARTSGPVKMTDDQLDQVTGGLVTIVAVDVVDVTTGDILRNVQVSANAAIAVLGNAIAQGRFRPQITE